MPVIPTTGPGGQRGAGQRRQIAPVVPSAGPVVPPQPARGGVPSLPAGTGRAPLLGKLADRLERRRLLKLRLKEREENRKESYRQALATAKIEDIRRWESREIDKLRVPETVLLAAIQDEGMLARIMQDPDSFREMLRSEAAKRQLTEAEVMAASSGAIQAILTALVAGQPLPDSSALIPTLQAEGRATRFGEVPLRREDGSPNPEGVMARLDAGSVNEFVLSFVNSLAEADLDASQAEAKLAAGQKRIAEKQQARLRLAGTSFIAASNLSPEETRQGLTRVVTGIKALAEDPAFMAQLQSPVDFTSSPVSRIERLAGAIRDIPGGRITPLLHVGEHLKAISDNPEVGWSEQTAALEMAADELLGPLCSMAAGKLPLAPLEITEIVDGEKVPVVKADPTKFGEEFANLTPAARAVAERLALDFGLVAAGISAAEPVRQSAVEAKLGSGFRAVLEDFRSLPVTAAGQAKAEDIQKLMIYQILMDAEREDLAAIIESELGLRKAEMVAPFGPTEPMVPLPLPEVLPREEGE